MIFKRVHKFCIVYLSLAKQMLNRIVRPTNASFFYFVIPFSTGDFSWNQFFFIFIFLLIAIGIIIVHILLALKQKKVWHYYYTERREYLKRAELVRPSRLWMAKDKSGPFKEQAKQDWIERVLNLPEEYRKPLVRHLLNTYLLNSTNQFSVPYLMVCSLLFDKKYFSKRVGDFFALLGPEFPRVTNYIIKNSYKKIPLEYRWEDYCFTWKMRTLHFIRWYLKVFFYLWNFFIIGIIYKWLLLFYKYTKLVFGIIYYTLRAPWQKYVYRPYLKRHAIKFNNLWQPKYRQFEAHYIQPRIRQFIRWYAFKFRVNKKAFFLKVFYKTMRLLRPVFFVLTVLGLGYAFLYFSNNYASAERAVKEYIHWRSLDQPINDFRFFLITWAVAFPYISYRLIWYQSLWFSEPATGDMSDHRPYGTTAWEIYLETSYEDMLLYFLWWSQNFYFLYYWVTQVLFFRAYDYQFLQLDRVHGNWLFRNRCYDFYTYLFIGRSYLRESRLDILFPKRTLVVYNPIIKYRPFLFPEFSYPEEWTHERTRGIAYLSQGWLKDGIWRYWFRSLFTYPNHSVPQAVNGMGGPLRYEEFQFTTKMYRLYSWAWHNSAYNWWSRRKEWDCPLLLAKLGLGIDRDVVVDYTATWDKGMIWSSRFDGTEGFFDREQSIGSSLKAHSVFRRTCAKYNIPLDYTFWDDWGHIFKIVLLAQIKEAAVREISSETAASLATKGLPFGPGRELDREESIAYWKRQEETAKVFGYWKRQLPTRTELSGLTEFQHDESFSHKLFISSTFCPGKYNEDSDVALMAWMLGDLPKHHSNYNHFWQPCPDRWCNNGLDDYDPYLISPVTNFLDVETDALWLYSKNFPIETILP
jgi:hypothetical protein